MSSLSRFLSQPFGVLWRTALVRLPRAVPLSTLRYTSPDGPHPFVFDLPSRRPESYSIPLYIFLPDSILQRPAHDSTPVPVLIDFHGGGFYLGSCLEQAPFCAQLARQMDCVVISVDYRMAPAHQFPAAIEDGEDVLRALLDEEAPGYAELRGVIASRIGKARALGEKKMEQEKERQAQLLQKGQIEQASSDGLPSDRSSSTAAAATGESPNLVQFEFDKSRIAISGFSSGGNLALNLALHIRPPDLQDEWPTVFPQQQDAPIPVLLFYPSLDLRQLPSERTRPENLPAGSSFWGSVSDLLAPTYIARSEAAHPRASPGLASIDSIHPAAKVFLVLAELDTLSEQSKNWVDKIREHARTDDVVIEEVRGVKHGWTQMPDGWLTEEERLLKQVCFEKARAFTQWAWTGSKAGEERPTSNVSFPPSATATGLVERERIHLGSASLEER